MKPIFEGSAVALITPFSDGKINYNALGKLIDFQIENGTSAILVLGTTGEPSTMNHEFEERELISFAAKKINKRVPMIVGAGSNDTRSAVLYSKSAEELGADALLHVTPYYNKATQKGLIAHYSEIAKNTSLPVILYNVPGRTGVNIQPKTVLELSKIENIVAIKEASGNMEQVVELFSLVGDKMTVYSGDDGITVPMMSMGAKGVISVAANIHPSFMAKMTAVALQGDFKQAGKMQAEIFELCKSMFLEVNPIPVKTAANLIGLQAGQLRLPLCEMEDANLEKLKTILKKYKLI